MAEDRRQPYIAMPEHGLRASGPEPDEARGRPRDSVGRLLRRTREHYGQDLETVAATLRIRHAYLSAIEESRFDELPGPTYAVGFVRSYADYLGLDDDEVVRRFKEEVEGLDRGTQLHFPAPVNEGRIPGGAILLVSLVLVAAVYGGWYYLSSQDSGIADLIPAVPERLQAVVGGQDDGAERDGLGADGDTATEVASQGGPSPEPGAESAAAAAVAEADAPAGADEATAADDGTGAARPQSRAAGSGDRRAAGTGTSEVGAAGEEPAEDARGELPAAAVEQATTGEPSKPAAPSRQSVRAEAATARAASEPSSKPAGEAQTAALPSVEPESMTAPDGGAVAAPSPGEQDTGGGLPPAPSDETTAAALSREPADGPTTVIPAAPDSAPAGGETSPGRVYGAANEDARIVLRATQDSWVQVRDADDTLLLTRVLRAGDSYRVPNRAGLTLVTGNAGGLTVLVDGQAIPALGPVGAVRRGIELDPAELRRSMARNSN